MSLGSHPRPRMKMKILFYVMVRLSLNNISGFFALKGMSFIQSYNKRQPMIMKRVSFDLLNITCYLWSK
jgi:hypothetical protein